MLTLYQQSETFGTSPANRFGIEHNPWVAWQFDRAVFAFGRTVMNRYEERDEKGRRVRTLDEALGLPQADPMSHMRRKLEQARQRGRAMRQRLGLIDK